MANDAGYELGWDDEIKNDSPEYVVLPECDCNFEVIDFERSRHPGSDKIPACNKAVVQIKVSCPEGSTTIKHNLFLFSKREWLLCEFFIAIGKQKKGEAIKPQWNSIIGATGRCRIGVHSWERTNDKGEKETLSANDIKKFYEPAEKPVQPTNFQSGKF